MSTKKGYVQQPLACFVRPRRRMFLSCWIYLFATTCLIAQTTSAIHGRITDPQGLAVAGATITVSSPALATRVATATDITGSYRVGGLEPGVYDLRFEKLGFKPQLYRSLMVTVNQSLTLDAVLTLSQAREVITVSAQPPMIDTTVSSSGDTILPREIAGMPLNGRRYLDLMQLVPGVTVNQQRDAGTDAAAPILGERGGNAIFLVDGVPNDNGLDGGPAAPFDQDSILEFQVLTSGYKAEFGHGSGGVVNVISKSGTDQWHGLLSGFDRNSAFDSSDLPGKIVPFLLRTDASTDVGGPVVKDRAFLFGSLERVQENRQLNFVFPPGVPDFLRVREESFDQRNQMFETRGFLKLDERTSRHHVSEQMNLVNGYVTNFLPLSQAIDLPSTRTDTRSRYLMVGFHDTAALGNQSNPLLLLDVYWQYRGEPSTERPAHPEAAPATTLLNLFSGFGTHRLFGDKGQVEFGAGFTPLVLKPRYDSAGAHFDKYAGKHQVAWGWDFERTQVDGTEATNLLNQLFATASDFAQFGPVNSGVYVLSRVAGPTAQDNSVHLRNNYNGLFAQDDWRISSSVTANIGLRWDYDSRFPNRANFSPRLGVVWSPNLKTVATANWGIFYDHFRLGLARDIRGFGGANLFSTETVSFPRLFYGDPSTLPGLFGLCLSANQTDAQLETTRATCGKGGGAMFGIDHLNTVVAPGHAAIAPNTVVNLQNVQPLTGLNPQQFADAASAAVGRASGFFFWGGFGNLTMNFPVPQIFAVPIIIDPRFRTPYTRAFHLGLERELGGSSIVQADYYHRDIRNMLGVRTANLAFQARLPGHTGELQPGSGSAPIQSYGPWYQGRYDGSSVGIRKRMGKRFAAEAFYTWAEATDNALNSNLTSEVQTRLGAGAMASNGPTDSFVGIPPLVTDPASGRTNAGSSFIASNGNPVPKAGKFYNGPGLDRGPSDLALNHTLLADGTVRLPWRFEISGIFRAQSGFHFTDVLRAPIDVDGDGHFNGVDFFTGRNHFHAPADVNLDARFSKRLAIGERVRLQAIFEFFNLLNRPNPAAVEQYQAMPIPLGKPLQYLPGREGQAGLRIEF